MTGDDKRNGEIDPRQYMKVAAVTLSLRDGSRDRQGGVGGNNGMESDGKKSHKGKT